MNLTADSLKAYVHLLIGQGGDLRAFAPEAILCATIVVLLLVPLFVKKPLQLGYIAFIGLFLAGVAAGRQWINVVLAAGPVYRELFQGMIVYDLFTVYMRLFLIAAASFVAALNLLTGIPDAEDSPDFFTLLLGSVVGMCLMASANHLLMVFIAVEMASVPSYAMAGFLKGRRQSSEAALKYVVYGGAAAGVMLYGLSLLAGMFGSVHLPTLAHEMLYRFSQPGGMAFNPALLLALVFVLVGLAFKLSAFPFHFWCPDVFEGAAAEVAGFLSVASKAAAIALAARFTLILKGVYQGSPGEAMAMPNAIEITDYLGPAIAILAGVTATFGNLAAYGQTNIKRMLAYSTIAHAGYMMMALATLSTAGVKAALFYLFIYLFMNIGAFAVVAFVRNETGSEEISSYAGLIHRAPWLAISMSVFLLSLVGMPPLGGFIAKFQVFAVLYESGWYSLLVVGGINTVISLIYYVNLMKIMIIRGEPTRQPIWEKADQVVYAGLMAAAVCWFGIFWNAPESCASLAAGSLEDPKAAFVRELSKVETPRNAIPPVAVGATAVEGTRP